MRLSLILCNIIAIFGLQACDRASPPLEQGDQAQSAIKAGATGKAIDTITSANGMTARLIRTYAGTEMPDAIFKGADGSETRLSNYIGRPLLLNIWATSCAPCKVEMPTLDDLAADQAREIVVIAVAQDLGGPEPVLNFFKDMKIRNLEAFTDTSNNVRAAFEYKTPFPTTILFNAQGKELWRIEGALEWDDPVITGLLNEASNL